MSFIYIYHTFVYNMNTLLCYTSTCLSCLWQYSASGPEGKNSSTGVWGSALVCWCFYRFDAETESFRCRNGSEKVPQKQHGVKREPKRAKELSKTPVRNRIGNWQANFIKIENWDIQNIIQQTVTKKHENVTKRCQKGTTNHRSFNCFEEWWL